MAESFGAGLLIGGSIALITAIGACLWIILRSLRPLGWAIIIALIIFLLTRL